MPHDHPHDHDHHHDHSHGHGHNHAHGDHLHSHMHEEDPSGDLQILAGQFIDAFRTASDKSAFLELAGIPREIPDASGGPKLKLVDVKQTTEWQVGTASPAFGSRELSYLPYPGPLVTERTNLEFVYVSAERLEAVDLRFFLSEKRAKQAEPAL